MSDKENPSENDRIETRIGEIAELGSGSTPARAKHDRFFSNGTIWWVKTGDLNNGLITLTDERITENAIKESACKIYPVDTVLVAMYGGFKQIGRTGVLGVPATINQALTAISVNKAKVNPIFLQHWLNAKVDVWRSLAGSSRKDPNITKTEVAAFPVLLPPLAEQKAIAGVISAWDRAIEQTTALIAAKERLKQGLMQQLLTGQRRFKEFSGEWREFVQRNSNFELVIDKSKIAFTKVDYDMADHFAEVSKMVDVGSGAKQQPSKQNSPSPSRREKGLGDEGWSTLLATQNPHPPTPSPFIKGEGEMRSLFTPVPSSLRFPLPLSMQGEMRSLIEMESRSINNTWIDFS